MHTGNSYCMYPLNNTTLIFHLTPNQHIQTNLAHCIRFAFFGGKLPQNETKQNTKQSIAFSVECALNILDKTISRINKRRANELPKNEARTNDTGRPQ